MDWARLAVRNRNTFFRRVQHSFSGPQGISAMEWWRRTQLVNS
jgi:hypothetical protein